MIRALVIDDSAFMRKALQIMLESDPEIRVIGTARDGEEGFQKVLQLEPDIVTLDIEMPRTNGLECLKLIMQNKPTPVLVVSSVTREGAAVTLEALDLGAVDFIPKSQSYVALDITKIKSDLIEKVKEITKRKRLRQVLTRIPKKEAAVSAEEQEPPHPYTIPRGSLSCIAVGVSTGGPPVVQRLCTALPVAFPYPVFVAQHMPKEFTHQFAERLNSISAVRVKEAEDGEQVERGVVYIGQGGKHLSINRNGVRVTVRLSSEPANLLYYPSADVLFESAAQVYGSGVLALILTGMGRDGVLGLAKVKSKGGKVLAQNEKSCVVYGMPKAAVDAHLADAVLSIDELVLTLQNLPIN
jgi:two-component system chemotaxis response regulator CheB